jgi:hypothetical protein
LLSLSFFSLQKGDFALDIGKRQILRALRVTSRNLQSVMFRSDSCSESHVNPAMLSMKIVGHASSPAVNLHDQQLRFCASDGRAKPQLVQNENC